jgi:hypothetical protein
MPRPRTGRLTKGEIVYARWHGMDEFEVVEEIFGTKLPHFKCKIWSRVAQKYDYWIFPQIHLSRCEIGSMTKEHNRKQLSLV